jgi:hypothetical protein
MYGHRFPAPLVLAIAIGVGFALPTSALPAPDPLRNPAEPIPHPRGYVCFRAQTPITIDGDLRDPAWDAADWTEYFIDIRGEKHPKPRYNTRVKMLWDDEALYIAAELEEPHLWGTLKAHDVVIFHDHDFEVFLDPDGDTHLYGELELNALNTTWDLLLTKPYRDGGRAITAWEITGLKTAVKLDGTLNDPRDIDRGWTIEIKWPWTGLKELVTNTSIPPRDGEQWRINFSRVEWDMEIVGGKYQKVKDRPEHNWVWSPQGAIDMHRPERWGYLQFSTGKKSEVQFKADPDWEIRSLLHRAYYAQAAAHKKTGKYLTNPADLGLKSPIERLKIEATGNRYEVSLMNEKTGRPRYTIVEDGRISK